jgi:hypothetical protein
MDLIVEMRFGAHLYGTETGVSDLDLKAVYLPEPSDILLQRVRPAINQTRARPPGEKNGPGDVDFEAYSLQRYMDLLAEGQTVAIDMLFAPDSALLAEPDPVWRRIQANAGRFVSARATAFLRYCRQQANRFGIKGSRVAAARQVLTLLQGAEARLGTAEHLAALAPELAALSAANAHVAVIELPIAGGRSAPHLDVCDKKGPFTASVKTAREIAQRLVAEYGARALQAERNEGVDWKALSHAVRVGHEALELFETGRIVFPLASAEHLRRIKQGELPFDTVGDEIERLLVAVETAAARSRLPEAPDQAMMETIVQDAYRRRVLGEA